MAFSNKHNTSHAAVAVMCAQFVARSLAQGLKGKARDRAALEFVLGAASLAHAIGDKTLYNMTSLLGFLVSSRGWAEIETRAKDAPADALKDFPEMPAGNGPLTTTFDVATVVAVGGDCYGVGTSIKEAERNMRKQNSRAKTRALRFYECDRAALKFECGVDLQILAPADARVARLAVEG